MTKIKTGALAAVLLLVAGFVVACGDEPADMVDNSMTDMTDTMMPEEMDDMTDMTMTDMMMPTEMESDSSGMSCEEIDFEYNDGVPDLDNCTLRVAVENAYRPFNFIDTETGEGVGYDYDFFNTLCERANCTTEFVETTWEVMIAVMAGESEPEFDVGANGITITAERDENVDFSDPYFELTEVLLVQLDEDRFSNVDEFVADSDLRIATQIGTTNAGTAVELVGEDRVLQQSTFGDAIQALISGDVDAVVIDDIGGSGYTGVNADQLRVLEGPPVSDDGGLGFIFVTGSELVGVVNWAIGEFRDDGTLAEIEAKFNPADA